MFHKVSLRFLRQATIISLIKRSNFFKLAIGKYFLMKIIFYLLLLVGVTASAQDLSLYQKKEFKLSEKTMPYRILFPENYDRTKKYPLVLFLHGAGERGNDNEKQLTHGAKLFLS